MKNALRNKTNTCNEEPINLQQKDSQPTAKG